MVGAHLARASIANLEQVLLVSDEPWVQRLPSHKNVSGREDVFRNGIRARDGKCVISGMVNKSAYRDSWAGFDAAHIFPLEKESLDSVQFRSLYHRHGRQYWSLKDQLATKWVYP